MGIQVADNFSLKSKKPLDERLVFDTVASMTSASADILYDGCRSYVKANKVFYVYDSSNTVDVELGKWREDNTGSSESVVDGYYNETDGKFYEEDTYQTEITGESNKIYISLDTSKSYYYENSIFVLLSGGGSEEVHIGDTAPTDGEDIWIDTDEEYITEIPFDIITHKPSIEGHTLQGNKTASDLGLAKTSDVVSNVEDMDDVEITSIEDGQILKYNSTSQKWENADDEGGAVDSVNGQTGIVVLDAEDVGALPDDTSIPSATSDLTNDSGFIDKSVNDLDNYTTTTDMNTALSGKVNTSSVGVASGVAELDANGKVPSSQLPSYVDDVVEGYYKESDGKFYEESTYETEIVGEADKIYISIDTNIQYRWSGNGYSALGGALQLGETSSTAYRGDRGKSAYDHSQLTSGNPHNVTKADVGLGNVDNTADLDKPISTAMQTALNGKVDVESGKGLSTNDYTTAEKEKLNGVEAGAEENVIETIMVNGSAQTVTNKAVNLLLTKENVGLGNVDNTSDLDKPISTATQTALNGKQDVIQVSELPTLTADINGKIYQYVGSDETTYKTGHFYKAIYFRRISYYWHSSGINCWTLKLPTNGLQVGDPIYNEHDPNCTSEYGTVTAIKGDAWIMAKGYDTGYTGTTNTIEEDIRWQDVSTEINDTTSSASTTYSSAKIDSLIPSADIYVGNTAPTNGETIWIDTSEDY